MIWALFAKIRQDTTVTFDDLVKSAAAKIKQSRVKRRTVARTEQYQHSPRLKLSRIYGYRMRDDERAERVPEEASIIRTVFNMFAQGTRVDEIKELLDNQGARTRFGNLFSVGSLFAMIKPIMAGLVAGRMGGYVKSSVYPPIVSPETFQKAQKSAKRQLQQAEIDPLKALLGGRS